MSYSNFFRAGVGLIVINQAGLVLASERSDTPGSWQFPQGGLDNEEQPLEAAYRELKEEVGLGPEAIDFLQESSDWLAYELPADKRHDKHGRGQVQKWVAFRFKGQDQDIDLNGGDSKPEFINWRWMKIDEVITNVIEFRRNVYRQLKTEFQRYLV